MYFEGEFCCKLTVKFIDNCFTHKIHSLFTENLSHINENYFNDEIKSFLSRFFYVSEILENI